MATSFYNLPVAFSTENINIAPSATLSVYVGVTGGQLSSAVYLYSGGTLKIIGTDFGATLSGTDLIAKGNSGFIPVGTTAAPFAIDGPMAYYLQACGTTSIVSKVTYYTQPKV